MNQAGRILAIDYGEKRIGLALSDPLKMFARPFRVIPNEGFESISKELADTIQAQNVELIIVGMPYAIEGGNTPKTDETQQFMNELSARIDTPLIAWDERYSTSEAISELIKMGYGWKERRGIQDAMAATMILKSFLASL